MAKTGTKLGLVDLSSDVSLAGASTGKTGTKLGLVDLSSNVPLQ